jgi:tetratricopeptide (TPR) repeat protein
MKTFQLSYTFLLLILFCITSQGLKAQSNSFNKDPFQSYYDGIELYEQAVYGSARNSLSNFLLQDDIKDPKFRIVRTRAEYYQALCALYLGDPEAEPLLDSWMRSYPQDPLYHQAGFELGNNFYNEKRYKEAVEVFDKIDPAILGTDQEAELYFKKGYCLFVQRDFNGAKEVFIATKDVRNQYFDSVNYYYGMCNYFLGDYDEAVASFDRCLNSPRFRSNVPYYISQIYFEQEKYDELIEFTDTYLKLEGINKQAELHQIVGQSYFLKKDYTSALSYLEYYESHSSKLTEEEFYQLAFTQYQTQNYLKASENFIQLTQVDNPIGQSSNYYLADCYLKLGDKASAMAAFKQVSQLGYDKEIQEEAIFQYAKLAAELNLESDAINNFLKLKPTSPFYSESQNLLSDLLIRTKNYVKAIEIIESINPRSKQLENAYQKACFLHANQLNVDNNTVAAIPYYHKAIASGNDLRYNAQAYFWIGKHLHINHQFKSSISNFNSYFNVSQQVSNLPFESSEGLGRYTQAYNYFKLLDYPNASKEFDISIKLLEKDKTNNSLKTKLLSDAYVRSADCHFKQNNYGNALDNYEKAIKMSSVGGAYAYYQKASIEGLQNRPYDKILSLEEMINVYPSSSLTDDAMLQLGNTYLSLDNKGLAEKVYRRLVNDFKGKSDLINTAYLKLGLISYNLGDAQRALNYYQSVINNNPSAQESQEAMLAIEEIYVEDLGDSEAYISFVESIPGQNLSEYSKDSISYYIAINQYKNGNYNNAVESLTKYIDRYPNGFYNIMAYYFRAESNSLLKEYNNALIDYQKVINLGISEKYESALDKASLISYNYKQDFISAYDYYDLLAEFTIDPFQKKQALNGALNSASRIPDQTKVIAVSNILLTDSLTTTEEKAHIFFLKGKAEIELEDMVEALRSLKIASKNTQNEEAAESRFLIGKILYDLQDMEEAETATKDAIRNNKSYSYWVAKSLILLSDIYVAQNSLLKARAALETVIENYQGDEDIVTLSEVKLAELEKIEKSQNRIKTLSSGDTLELEEQN